MTFGGGLQSSYSYSDRHENGERDRFTPAFVVFMLCWFLSDSALVALMCGVFVYV
jgi:hypothetical protein